VPFSDPANVDPEEAYVAALSSCHMLWFLSIAASAGYVVDAYDDHAEGVMAKNEAGRLVVTTVTLKPHVKVSGSNAPTDAALDELHHRTHEECFLANSVRTAIDVKGSWEYVGA
jgi:organic hydroperoxide reductase OsmC/OhrA